MTNTDALGQVLTGIIGERHCGGCSLDPVSGRSGILQICLSGHWMIVIEAHCTILSLDGALEYATDDPRDSRQFHLAHDALAGSTLTGATVTDEGMLTLVLGDGATLIAEPTRTPDDYASAWWIGSPEFGRVLCRPDGQVATAPWPVTGICALTDLIDYGRLPDIDGPPDGRLCTVLLRRHLIDALERGCEDSEHLQAWARIIDSFDSIAIWYERDAQAQMRTVIRILADPDRSPPAEDEIDALITDLEPPGRTSAEPRQPRRPLWHEAARTFLLTVIQALAVITTLAVLLA